ncbi:hypothetical protein BGZ73_002270 [Actinomortierella ambigua]|nr:hypothetical protein BGZ73_002270 [Actinomortierella ambigua]
MTLVPDSGQGRQARPIPDPSQEQERLLPRQHQQQPAQQQRQQQRRPPSSYGTLSSTIPPPHPPHRAATPTPGSLTRSTSSQPPPASPSSRSTRSSNNPSSPRSSSAAYSNAVAALDLATGNLGRRVSAEGARRAATHGKNHPQNQKRRRPRRNTGASAYSYTYADIAARPESPVSAFSLHNLPIPTTGSSVAIVIIPQSVAYALLASLPPVYGLYTSLVPALVYTIFGTSRHMSPGTFAITSLLLGQSVHKILADQGVAEEGSMPAHRDAASSPSMLSFLGPEEYQQRYLTLCLMMTFMIGIMQVVLGFARLGRWISRSLVPTPLVSGFNTASAFHIGTHQIKHLLGMKPPRFSGTFGMLRTWIWILDGFFSKVAWPTFGLGMAAILTMIGLQRLEHWRRKRARSLSPSDACASSGMILASPSTLCAAACTAAATTSDQSLLTIQDVAIERESRLGRRALDSPDSSTLDSPEFGPARDAPLHQQQQQQQQQQYCPSPSPPSAVTLNNQLSPRQPGPGSHSIHHYQHYAHPTYRTTCFQPETGLYNTGAAHSRPNPLKVQPYSQYNGKKSQGGWRHAWQQPPMMPPAPAPPTILQDGSRISPSSSHSVGSVGKGRSDEEHIHYKDEDDDDGDNDHGHGGEGEGRRESEEAPGWKMADGYSPKAAKGEEHRHEHEEEGPLYVRVDECRHKPVMQSKHQDQSVNDGDGDDDDEDWLTPHRPETDRRCSSRLANADLEANHLVPNNTNSATTADMAGPWTPLLSGNGSILPTSYGAGHSSLEGARKEVRATPTTSATATTLPSSTTPNRPRLPERAISSASTILVKLRDGKTRVWTVLSKAHFPIPDIFLCLVLWTGVTVAFDLDKQHAVKVVGTIPSGLPTVSFPPIQPALHGWDDVWPSLWPSLVMSLMIYVMTLAVAKHFGKLYEYEVDPDQEMRALGLGSLVGSCFGGYACTGNLTRSAILAQTGAKTPLATVVSCGMVLMTLLWWTRLLERVPETVLAAVVLVSLQTLMVQAFEARGLWRVGRRMDAVIWWTTFSMVMVFSIEIGLAVGMAVVVLYQIKKRIRGWKQTICQSVLCQRVMLILGLQSPLHTSVSRGLHAGDDDDDDY